MSGLQSSRFNDVPWFLRALFLIICLFTLLKYISGRINNDIVEVFILLVFGYLLLFITTRLIRDTALDSIFNMTVFQIHYPYFVLGYLYHKYENKYKKYLDSNYLYTICILIFVALFYEEMNDAFANVPRDRIINMDETFWRVLQSGALTVADMGAETVSCTFSADEKEGFTAICSIDAAGNTLPCWVLAKGKTRRCEAKFRENPQIRRLLEVGSL